MPDVLAHNLAPRAAEDVADEEDVHSKPVLSQGWTVNSGQ
jgi:hypothetical protein